MAIEVNESTFSQEVLSSQKPVLVDFWAPWCGPCKMLSPVIDEIAAEYEGKAKVVKVNTDANMSLSSQYQIASIPCLILFKGGNVIQRVVGFRSKNDLKKLIDSVL
ncbi:MAG: thioredoxin [Endomicrobium sp.]|jgi:thioredoxin 1|nr:thioredoxin [Endomicrobium sp.]